MADYNEKRCWKSNFVPRECVDGLELDSSDVQESDDEPALLREMNPENVKIPERPPPIQFSINVEVEECSEDYIMGIDDSPQPETYDSQNSPINESGFTTLHIDPSPGSSKNNSVKRETDNQAPLINDLGFKSIQPPVASQEVTTMRLCHIAEDVLRKQTEKLMETTTSLADKILEIGIRNRWGNKVLPLVKTAREDKLQLAIDEWSFWNKQSRFRDTVYCYKCYCCDLAWWHLTPFREHLQLHDNIDVAIETSINSCNIIAFDYSSGRIFRHIPIEGDCWRCLKDFQEHVKLLPNGLFYCEACHERFTSCTSLGEHEGKCLRYIKIHYKDVVRSENDWKCHYCNTFYITQDRYNKHMAVRHTVRSDVPIAISLLKSCTSCNFKYIISKTHYCPVKPSNYQCKYCCRQFQSLWYASQHEALTQSDYNCPVCHKFLQKRCLEMEHMILHSDNYMLAYRCTTCEENILFPDDVSLMLHNMSWHGSVKLHKRYRPYEMIVVPKSSMTCSNVEELDIVDTVQDVFMLPDQYGDVPAVAPKPIEAENKRNIHKSRKRKRKKRPIDIIEIEEEIKKNDELLNKLIQRTVQNKHMEERKAKVESDVDKTTDNIPQDDSLEYANEIKMKVDCETKALKLSNDETRKQNSIIEVNELLTDDTAKETNKIEINAMLHEEVSKECGRTAVSELDVKSPRDCSTNEETKHLNELATSHKVEESEIDLTVVKSEMEDIKPDNDDYEEFYEVVDELTEKLEIKEEVCFEETLSNIFRASNHVTGTSVSPRSIFKDKIVFKEEPSDEEFEDDLIILNPRPDENRPNHRDNDSDTSITFDVHMSELNRSETSSIGHSPEVDVSNSALQITKHGGRKRKRYQCCRCNFEGYHRQYSEHIQFICPRNTSTKINKDIKHCDKSIKFRKEPWKTYVCTKCDKEYSSMKSYLLHFQAEHNLYHAQCPYCLAVLKHLDTAAFHVMSHIKNSFLKIKLIKQSSEVSSKRDGLFQCKTCTENFIFEDFFAHWERHLKIRHRPQVTVKEEVMESPEVSVLTEHTEDLLSHEMRKKILDLLIHNTNETRVRACIVCTHTFHRRTDFKRHLIEHLLRDAYANKLKYRALRCQECAQRFQKTDKYKLHMRQHASLPLYKCELCNRAFSDSSNFTKHKKLHNLQALVCDICGRKFQAKGSIERHMEMHRVTAPMPCDRCDQVFYYSSHLLKHVKSRHDKPFARFPCIICKATFRCLKDKWDHLWEVHKERKFKADCPFCNKSYRKYQDVKRHVMVFHNMQLNTRSLLRFLENPKKAFKLLD